MISVYAMIIMNTGTCGENSSIIRDLLKLVIKITNFSRMAKARRNSKATRKQRGGNSQRLTLAAAPTNGTSFTVSIPASGYASLFTLPSGAKTPVGLFVGRGGAKIDSVNVGATTITINITGGTIPTTLKAGAVIPYSATAPPGASTPKPLSLVDQGEVQYGVSISGAPPNNTEIVVKNDNFVKPGDASSGTAPGFPAGTAGVGYVLTGKGVPDKTTIKSYRFGSSNFGGKFKAIFLQLSNPITPQSPAATYMYASPPLSPEAYWTASGGGKRRGVSRRR